MTKTLPKLLVNALKPYLAVLQPACVLPFGGIYNEEDDEIELALGVNDSFMGIFKCPLVNILALLEPTEVGTNEIS